MEFGSNCFEFDSVLGLICCSYVATFYCNVILRHSRLERDSKVSFLVWFLFELSLDYGLKTCIISKFCGEQDHSLRLIFLVIERERLITICMNA